MPRAAQQYEDNVRSGFYPDSPNATPESAIVGIDVDSMAGSGISVFADFGDAVCWFWRVCEDVWGSGSNGTWPPDEEVPTELQAGRQRFRALLQRFISGGYTRDMAQELHDIVFDLLGGNWAVGGYEVGSVKVLPTDLDGVLEWWRDSLDDDGLAADDDSEEMDSEEMAAAETLGKPPQEPFDLANPAHFAALARWLEQLTEV